jgi:hypothetical protein
MSRKILTMPLAELIEDLSVYPRHAVDDSNVQSLALALEAGCELPPLIADQASKRIVDGWHRGRAHKRVYGPGATVRVELRTYPNEAALKEDAVALNSRHGRRLDVMDQTRAVLMLEKEGVPMDRIALILNVTAKRCEALRIRVADARVATAATVPETHKITLKRSVAHLQGKTLTREQAEAHDSMPGTSFLLIARQLATALRTRLVNLKDDRLLEALKELREELKKLD